MIHHFRKREAETECHSKIEVPIKNKTKKKKKQILYCLNFQLPLILLFLAAPGWCFQIVNLGEEDWSLFYFVYVIWVLIYSFSLANSRLGKDTNNINILWCWNWYSEVSWYNEKHFDVEEKALSTNSGFPS